MRYKQYGTELLLYDDGLELSLTANEIYRYEQDCRHGNSDAPSLSEIGLRFSSSFATLQVKVEPSETSSFGVACLYARSALGDSCQIHAGHRSDYVVIGKRVTPVNSDELNEIKSVLSDLGVDAWSDLSLSNYLDLLRIEQEWPWLTVEYEVNAKDISFSSCSLTEEVEEPSSFKLDLFDYQKVGSGWLSAMVKEGIGVILGDGMGLGKTAQAIKTICDKLEADPGARILIICPSALVENWRREIDKFTTGLDVMCHYGPDRTRYFGDLSSSIVITTYDVAKNDRIILSQHLWDIVILDEAQFIKNPKSQRAAEIKKIKRRVGIAITGTPFENHMTDIWSLIDFCNPDYLGSENAFKSKFKDEAGSARNLGKLIAPLLLRRTLDDIPNDLPELITIPVPISLPVDEAREYDERKSQYKSEGVSLATINKLIGDLSIPKEGMGGISSLKYEYLNTVANEVFECGEKMIVFAGRNECIDFLFNQYSQRVPTYRLTGETKQEDRLPTIDLFSGVVGPALLICNPRVGGAGLNITAANHVFHFTSQWNPAVIDQADARAHRRGQRKTVISYYPYYASTVEEYMWNKVMVKRDLADDVVVGNLGDATPNEVLEALRLSPL